MAKTKTTAPTTEMFDPKLFVDSISHEQGLSKEEVYGALGTAIETAIRREYPEGSLLTVKLSTEPFSIRAYRKYEIVDKVEDYETQITKKGITTEIVEDGFALEEVPVSIDRQKFNIVRQVIRQRLKNTSRQNQINNLLSRKNQLFYGTVKVVKRDQILVEAEGLEVTLPRKNCIGREKLTVNQRIFFVLEEENGQYYASRSNTDFLKQVLNQEIYDLENGSVEIMAVSRVAGFRSKVVVRSNTGSDAVKTCIGQGAKNLRSIQEYLSGEYVDFIEYTPDMAKLLVEAFKPIQLISIQIDENSQNIRICVSDEDIGRAIGKFNNNINLVNGLVPFNVEAFSETDWEKKDLVENNRLAILFENGLSCDRELAEILIANNFTSLEEVAYVPEEEFDIDEIDSETIAQLRENAREVVEDPVALKRIESIADLTSCGFTSEEISILTENEVSSLEDIADLGTYDLIDILPDYSEEEAQKLIMKVRQSDPRFTE